MTRDVPRLRATLKDKADHEIKHWIFNADEDHLLPGQTGHFKTGVNEPDLATAKIEVAVAHNGI